MQNIGVYLVLLVTGALIGASVMSYVTMNRNATIADQVKVSIQDINYDRLDSVMKIELFNDVPEKNFQGKIIISQVEKQWTSDVNWLYTGYGKAELICDSINENQNFNIKYIENNPEATYLDRTIEWNEVFG
jgi:hypothetical protein